MQLLKKRVRESRLLLNKNVHESGRATLPVDSEIVKFFEEHLINVKTESINNQEETTLEFDTDQYPIQLISTVSGVSSNRLSLPNAPSIFGLKEVKGKILIYGEDHYIVYNQDVISVVNNIKAILRQGPVTTTVVPYYIELMTALLTVGNLYSSFVEILFANMFITDYDKKEFWRYRQDLSPTYKLGDKMMASFISSRIGLLYQPNKDTIEKVDLEELDTIDLENLTIYEKIYLGQV